jgi:hypothetical protein
VHRGLGGGDGSSIRARLTHFPGAGKQRALCSIKNKYHKVFRMTSIQRSR